MKIEVHPCGNGVKVAAEYSEFDNSIVIYENTNAAMALGYVRLNDIKRLQKPLTLEETKEQVAVYCECVNAWDEPIPTLYVCSDKVSVCFDHGFGEQERLLVENYNRKWRCWATKPTDEERRAAAWEK